MIYEVITLSFYCHCATCCGKEGGLTASDTIPRAWVTAAAGSRFKFGDILLITCKDLGWIRKQFTVEDRLSKKLNVANSRIDIFVGGPHQHDYARVLGLKKAVIEFELPKPRANGTKTAHDSVAKPKRRGVVVEPKPSKAGKSLHASPESNRRGKEAAHPNPGRRRIVRRGP